MMLGGSHCHPPARRNLNQSSSPLSSYNLNLIPNLISGHIHLPTLSRYWVAIPTDHKTPLRARQKQIVFNVACCNAEIAILTRCSTQQSRHQFHTIRFRAVTIDARAVLVANVRRAPRRLHGESAQGSNLREETRQVDRTKGIHGTRFPNLEARELDAHLHEVTVTIGV